MEASRLRTPVYDDALSEVRNLLVQRGAHPRHDGSGRLTRSGVLERVRFDLPALGHWFADIPHGGGLMCDQRVSARGSARDDCHSEGVDKRAQARAQCE